MSKIRQELMDLSKECEARCEEFGWLSKARVPNYHLLYSSVETYEHGNGLAILGINPAGGPEGRRTLTPTILIAPIKSPGTMLT